MKKILSILCLTGVLLVGTQTAEAVPISGLFNTGVDDSGVVLPSGTLDPHYSLTGPASPAYAITQHPNWVVPPPGSSWIGPSNGSVTDPVGVYSYLFTFDLTGLDHTTAAITGNWAADNEVHLFLNGVDTGLSTSSFTSLSAFALTSGFQAGENTLEFRVTNWAGTSGNPTSLLVANLSGSANAVPEPATMALFGTGLLGAAFGRKRKK